MKIPLIRPNPARLSTLSTELAQIESAGIYSNYGPVNTRFETAIVQTIFGGVGACVTVCNATIGLMLALKHVVQGPPPERRFALMPSFTFAASAHAALWAGLTPLLCDIDEQSWLPAARSEEQLLERFGRQIAVLMPYATFGNDLDLARYRRLSDGYRVPVVVDAAASLGTLDAEGRGFGTGSTDPIVFSLHATKAFATLEGGLIYAHDSDAIRALRAMGNFGFAEPRTASMPGLNAKLSEIVALMGLHKLAEFDQVVAHREALAESYRAALPGWTFQRLLGRRHAFTFASALLPECCAGRRSQILQRLAEQGIGAGAYFSPHLAEQPYFKDTCVAGDLPVTDRVAARMISLPISDAMTTDDARTVARALANACEDVLADRRVRPMPVG